MTQTASAEATGSSLPAEDFFLTLNGFDEIAIAQRFGADISGLRERPMSFLRALAFVDLRRKGKSDPEAHRAAMEMPISNLMAYFPDATPEVDPADPETDQGKGDSLSE